MKTFLVIVCAAVAFGCSSAQTVKSQAYAQLSNEKTFEYDFPTVWKGIEAAVREWKITDRDPNEVEPKEEASISKRTMKTDWIYTRSTDKYVEYKVNGSPRKQYLQLRVRYQIVANRVVGGVKVNVGTEEEVERLKADGNPDGYASADRKDSGRAHELLDRIENSIRSLPPI